MSDLFMDMHRRRQTRNADIISSNSSLNTSACSDHRRRPRDASANEDDANEVEDEISNILSLKLKKPKHWKWELTTSRSCMNIALPRILLYDHTGQLLVDANTQEEQVYTAAENIPDKQRNNSASRKRSNRAATANLAHSIRQALNQEFDGLQIQEATPSIQSPTASSVHSRNSSPLASSTCIDFYTNDLPDYKFERGGSGSSKGVRFKDDDTKSSGNSFQINGLPTPPPSSGTTPTTGTSSASEPREKRRYKRSRSFHRTPINSPSILERFSFTKGRFSSPECEHAEEQEVYRAPRYFLRTSKAGTLIVQEESFSRYRRRPPRPKNYSSESLHNGNLPRSPSVNSLKMPPNSGVQQHSSGLQAGSLQNIAITRRRKKSMPIRRFRSVGNILQVDFPSSDEEHVAPEYVNQRSRHGYDHFKRHLKGELVTIDPEHATFHPYGSPTER